MLAHYFNCEVNSASLSIAGMQNKLLQPDVKIRQRLMVFIQRQNEDIDFS